MKSTVTSVDAIQSMCYSKAQVPTSIATTINPCNSITKRVLSHSIMKHIAPAKKTQFQGCVARQPLEKISSIYIRDCVIQV